MEVELNGVSNPDEIVTHHPMHDESTEYYVRDRSREEPFEGVTYDDDVEDDDDQWEDSSSVDEKKSMEDVDDVRAPVKVQRRAILVAAIAMIFPLGSIVADMILTVALLRRKRYTYGYFSLTLLIIAGIYLAFAVGAYFKDARGTRGYFERKCRVHERFSIFQVGVSATLCAPMCGLQAYMLIADLHDMKDGLRVGVFIAFFIGAVTIVVSVVLSFFHWESWKAKVHLGYFFLALLLARCGAFGGVFVEHGTAAFAFLFFCVAMTLAGLMKLRRTITMSDEPPYLFDELIWVPPILALWTLTPFGGGALGSGGGTDSDLETLLTDADISTFGKLFAFVGGAKVNTFRSRLMSDVPVYLILLNGAETLAMILATAIPAAGRRGSPQRSNAADPLALCLISFLFLATAPLAYFTAFGIVKDREDLWRRIIHDAKEVTPPDEDGHIDASLLVRDVNRRSSYWNNVVAKYYPPRARHDPRPLTHYSIVYLPNVLKDCHKAYGRKVPEFSDLDALLGSLDAEVWASRNLRKFDKLKNFLSLRLQLHAAATNDASQIQSVLLNAISNDNVRPMMRIALDNLNHQLIAFRNSDSITMP